MPGDIRMVRTCRRNCFRTGHGGRHRIRTDDLSITTAASPLLCDSADQIRAPAGEGSGQTVRVRTLRQRDSEPHGQDDPPAGKGTASMAGDTAETIRRGFEAVKGAADLDMLKCALDSGLAGMASEKTSG